MEASLSGLRSTHRSFDVTDTSSVASARRGASEAGRAIAFDETDLGRLSLVVTEASTNILKHAQHGEILVRVLPPDAAGDRAAGIEVIAIDHGPGMTDVRGAFSDGRSTAGTSGTGLGAIRRLSDELSIWSQPGHGTVLRVVLRARVQGDARRPPAASGIDIGGICTCLPGEEVSGDAWGVDADQDGLTVTVADGLGHGPDAHVASSTVVESVRRRVGRSPAVLMAAAHAALHATRGAAVAIARFDLSRGRLSFSGTGNIAAVGYRIDRPVLVASHPTSGMPGMPGMPGASAAAGLTGARSGLASSGPAAPDAQRDSWQLTSRNGIVGHTMRDAQEFETSWPRDAMLVLHSDGIGTRWDLSAYPGLLLQPAVIIAAVLYRDFCRRRDDATVVIVKSEAPQALYL